MGGDEIASFMERVPDHVLVVFDEAYIELLPPERQPDTVSYIRVGRPLCVLRTFSKAYGLAGLRIGYIYVGARVRGGLGQPRPPAL